MFPVFASGAVSSGQHETSVPRHAICVQRKRPFSKERDVSEAGVRIVVLSAAQPVRRCIVGLPEEGSSCLCTRGVRSGGKRGMARRF